VKYLKIYRMVATHAGEIHYHGGVAQASETEGLVAYTDEGSFVIPCESMRLAFPFVVVDEEDASDRVALGVSS